MGCTASQKTPSATPVQANAAEKTVESQTWATKTEDIKKVPKDRGSDTARSQPVVLQDADDDEVEILTEARTEKVPEVEYETEIYESGQVMLKAKVKSEQFPGRTEPPAANAQEAPSSLESSSTPSPSRPLPKQQQEEAAKLAETRRRFDNQRYQSQGAAAGANTSPVRGSMPNSFCPPGALPGAPDMVEELPSSINGGAKASSGGPSGAKAWSSDGVNHPLVVGLSLNKAEGNVDDSKLGAFLPGGILDDSDLPSNAMPRHKEPAQKPSPGFSADDEALMREILEDVDDIEAF